ncbi:MAG TPA: hypothetical protein PKY13_03500 [Microthrixaceae bacterium]|nr:hypothetical protein [Microthrixaceae bacterium]HQF93031.1 hypothetical protein [Microthrixaceae bacterium]
MTWTLAMSVGACGADREVDVVAGDSAVTDVAIPVRDTGDTDLCARIRSGEEEAAKAVREERPPRSRDRLSDPVICAILSNNLPVAQVLVDLDYDLNWRIPEDPPVMSVFNVGDVDSIAPTFDGGTWTERRRAVLRLFLDNGLDACERYSTGTAAGETAYEVAKSAGELNTVRLYEDEGADCSGSRATGGS